MNSNRTRSAAKWTAAALGFAATSCAAYLGLTWFGYGKKTAGDKGADGLLDLFIPDYEVMERHQIRVSAPATTTLAAATEMDLGNCAVVRGIFKGRELILRSEPEDRSRPHGLLAEMKALGWGLLAELPAREFVVGGVTKPWEPNPVFRSIPPDEFAAFAEPGYVKIVWTLRADQLANGESVFRTETRAVATDPQSRKRFRRYWLFFSPGIKAIRRAMLMTVKAEAERRAGIKAA